MPEPRSTRELHVYMGGEQVAVVTSSSRRLRLVYDDQWQARDDATPLSVSMPVAVPTHTHKTVHPYLWGLLPDNELVINRWASDAQCSPSDVAGLLASVGADAAGAAQYLPPGVDPDEAAPGTIEPLDEIAVSRLLATIRHDAAAWHGGLTGGRWSLAGAQGKIALAYDEMADEWGIPAGSAPTTHILKPAIAGLADHDLNEHLCLRTAAKVGLSAAVTSLRSFGRERALSVVRYDRVTVDGHVVRVHQEDCCQALSVHPTGKYENEGGPSLGRIADLLHEVIPDGPTAEADVNRLCRAAAFNWLILGTDAHAKNYSLLLDGPDVRLAPLYDVASALPYGDHPRKLKLAHKVGGYYRPHVLSERHWAKLADQSRIAPDELITQIRDMAQDIPDAMHGAIAETPLTLGERKPCNRLLDLVYEWTAECARRMKS